MTTSLEEARQLKALVEKRKGKQTFMVGHQFVYHDHVRYLRSLIDGIDGNSIGNVRYAFGEHMLFQSRPDVGCLWDAGPHQLSMLQYLLSPGKIVKVVGRSVAMSDAGSDDFTAATVEFKSGLLATIIVSWFGAKKTRKLTVVGDKKVSVFDDVEKKDKLKLFSHSAGLEIPKISAKEPLRNELEHFVHCIKTGEMPLTGADSSYEIAEWLDKISRSVLRPQHDI